MVRKPRRQSGPKRPAGRTRPGAKSPVRLEFAVWQFVRIMVRVEERAAQSRGRARSSIHGAWRDRWRELDRRLTKLGREDADGFADLMMRQEVVIEDATPQQRSEVARVLGEVIAQLKGKIRDGGVDESQARDLRYEQKQLEVLRARLIGRR